MNRFHLLVSTLFLGSLSSWVQAETTLPPVSGSELVVSAEPKQAPTMVGRARNNLGEGIEQIQQTGASALKRGGEYGGDLVNRGQQAAEKAWSSTQRTSAEWTEKSLDSASRAGEAVARATNNTVQSGAAAWDATKQVSVELWEKGQRVGHAAKQEIVGSDGPAAEVIDKSLPIDR